MTFSMCVLLERLSDELMAEIYALCPRRVRNMLEGKYGHGKPRNGRQVSLKFGKNRAQEALTVRAGIVAGGDTQMAEELIKTYLYGKRPLLKDTLDYLGLPNEDGLTDGELDVLEQATPETLRALFAVLREKGHSIEDIALYFAFTKVEHFADIEELTRQLGQPA